MSEHFPPQQSDEPPGFTEISPMEAVNQGTTLREALNQVSETLDDARKSVTKLSNSNRWVMKKEDGTYHTLASDETMAATAAQAMNDGVVPRLVELKAFRGSGRVIGILRGTVPAEAVRVRQRIMGRRYGGCTATLVAPPVEQAQQPGSEVGWPTEPDPNNPQAFWVEAIGLPEIDSSEALVANVSGSTSIGAVNPQGEFLDWNTVLTKMSGSQYRASQ